ncbi:MAG: hypothetical protein QM775_23200 [Pirellulales bacterium]
MAKKLNSAGLNKFFAERGEYVGLALAVVLGGLLVYSAFGVPKYAKTPEDLKRDVLAAQTVFSSADSRLNLESEGITTKGGDFLGKIDKQLLTPVNPASYAGMEWNIPLFDTKQRRTEPEYFALRDLCAEFHYGAIDMKVSGGGGNANAQVQRRAVGEEWLTVTGLIPLEEQEAAYAKAFAGALDSRTNSRPEYLPYEIQKTEVVNLDPNAPVDWQNITPLVLSEVVSQEMAKWAGNGAEYVEQKYVNWPFVTEPLPPLTNKDYGDWAAHLPEIAAAPVAAQPARGAAPAAAARVEAAPAGNPADPFAPAAGGAAAAPAPAAPKPDAQAAASEKPKYLLFRFLDFNIEPTKAYRYRVKLIVKNPNHKLDVSHLEDAKLADGESRETPWSEPSAPVAIPVLEKYFAGEGKSVGGDSEPETSFAVKQWSPRFAADIFYEFDKKLRVALLNDPAAVVKHRVPGDKRSTDQQTSLVTNVLLADFAWEKTVDKLKGPGGALEAKMTAKPAEMLVRTPRGELMIQTQLGDWMLRDELKAVVSSVGAANPGEDAPAENPDQPSGDDVRRRLMLK